MNPNSTEGYQNMYPYRLETGPSEDIGRNRSRGTATLVDTISQGVETNRSRNKSLDNLVGGDPGLTSIVILSYNRRQDLENNIESLYENTELPFEVIIYDNDSGEETRNFLQSIDGQSKEDGNGKVKVIQGNKNLGCSGGRQQALKFANGDYVCTIDNDMTYTPGWLNALIDRAEEDSRIGAVNSRIVFPNGKVQLNGGKLVLEEGYFGSFEEVDGGKNKDSQDLTGKIDCDWVCGGATLFKREVVDQVEHSPEYLNGYEDYDYALQIANLGYRLVNCPNSTLVHNHIQFDEEKQRRETAYLKDRWSTSRTWSSLVYFLERTGINLIKTSAFYDWLDQDGSKPFLKMGNVGGVEIEYEDLYPGQPFSDLTNEQLRRQFDHIIQRNREVREGTYFGKNSLGSILNNVRGEMDKAFTTYNLANLEAHLEWSRQQYFEQTNPNTDLPSYLISQFKEGVVERNPEEAETIYSFLRETLTSKGFKAFF